MIKHSLPPFDNEPSGSVFRKICNDQVEYPEHIEPAACDLISKLLVVDADRRLSNPAEIKSHEWFSDIDWDELIDLRVPGPLNPEITGDDDVHHFLPRVHRVRIHLLLFVFLWR